MIIADPSGTVHNASQFWMSTVRKTVTGYPVSITNIIMGSHVYRILIQKVGPSTVNVITSGPEDNCRFDEEKTLSGAHSLIVKDCNQTNHTADWTGYIKLSLIVRLEVKELSSTTQNYLGSNILILFHVITTFWLATL
jgi:hypothetical protein